MHFPPEPSEFAAGAVLYDIILCYTKGTTCLAEFTGHPISRSTTAKYAHHKRILLCPVYSARRHPSRRVHNFVEMNKAAIFDISGFIVQALPNRSTFVYDNAIMPPLSQGAIGVGGLV